MVVAIAHGMISRQALISLVGVVVIAIMITGLVIFRRQRTRSTTPLHGRPSTH